MWRVLIFIGLLIAGYFDTPPEFNGEPVQMGFWNFVIQGAAMGIGALLNRKKKKDAGEDVSNEALSPEEQQAIQMLMQTGQLSMEQAQQLFGISSEMIQGAQESFAGAQQDIGSARDYFNKLMSGDTAAQAEFFAPESQRIQQTYSQAAEQARRFGGAEGGESARLKSDLRAQKTGELARLYSSARPAAAQGLMQTAQIGAGIGGQQAQAGTSLASTGMQGFNTAVNAAGNILYPFQQMRQNDLERRRQNIGIWGSIGKGVGGILADMFKNRKAGANTSGGITTPDVGPL